MSAWRIEWSRIVDRGLAEEIRRAADADEPLSVDDLRRPVGRILAATGGWPYVERLPSAAQVRAHVRKLLGEALVRASGGRGNAQTGYQLVDARDGAVRIEPAERVETNIATAEALAAGLSGISARIARAIVDERDRRGPFRNLADLTDRVDGFGPRRAKRLASVLGFRRDAERATRARGSWRQDLSAMLALETGPTLRERTVSALETVARIAESERHPYLKHRLPQPFTKPAVPSRLPSEACHVLAGRRYYYYVRNAIRRARNRIDLAMFHIALPSEDHPTRQLLDALAQAHRRGVAIRVLVDRDRRDDVYRSSVINAAAIQRLLASGVRVRVDRADRLLHSKFAVLDGELTVIGSHNWSAGSYFGFDDLSVAVQSVELARDVRRRFDALWRRGEAARPGRGTLAL